MAAVARVSSPAIFGAAFTLKAHPEGFSAATRPSSATLNCRGNPLSCSDRNMQERLHHRGNYLVRRQRLAPGEASPWHRDPYHRVTVVLSGDRLEIEFRDGGESVSCDVKAGEVDWSEPSSRVHRAVNAGKEVFEEVVTFFLDRPDADPQPEEPEHE